MRKVGKNFAIQCQLYGGFLESLLILHGEFKVVINFEVSDKKRCESHPTLYQSHSTLIGII